MQFEEIKELIKLFDESSITSLTIKEQEFAINLAKEQIIATTQLTQPQNVVIQQPQIQTTQEQPKEQKTVKKSGEELKSPMVGTFYRCPSPDKPAFVNVGDRVKKGQTLCILEAMKIMNEIEAEFDCKILEFLVDDGQPVEYDMPLFLVERV
ncbi:MAG: acetyl-CoA carboxylase biotin carboxyl carrier protein [Campylobacterales bacterium]|nr:acetyl-CoA carboxylase biotin carboxyl carrier protein [Campylobacterales bacterium]